MKFDSISNSESKEEIDFFEDSQNNLEFKEEIDVFQDNKITSDKYSPSYLKSNEKIDDFKNYKMTSIVFSTSNYEVIYNTQSLPLTRLGREPTPLRKLLSKFTTKNNQKPTAKNFHLKFTKGIKICYRFISKCKVPKKFLTKIDINNQKQYQRWLDLSAIYLKNQQSFNENLNMKKSLSNANFKDFYENNYINKEAFKVIIDIIFSNTECSALCNLLKIFCCSSQTHTSSCQSSWNDLEQYLKNQYLTNLGVNNENFKSYQLLESSDSEDLRSSDIASFEISTEFESKTILKKFRKCPSQKSNKQRTLNKHPELNDLSERMYDQMKNAYNIFIGYRIPSTIFDITNKNHREEWKIITDIFRRLKDEQSLELLVRERKKKYRSFFREFYQEESYQLILKSLLNVLFSEINCDLLCSKFKFSCCNLNTHSSECLSRWDNLKSFLKINYFHEIEIKPCIDSHYVYMGPLLDFHGDYRFSW